MNYKLFSIAYCFLVVSSFVYSSSYSSDHSRTKNLYHQRVTFLPTDSVDNAKLLTNNDFTKKAPKVPFSQGILQNHHNETVVSQREISIQVSTKNESSETLIQTLKEKLQEVEEKLKIKESVIVEQGKIIASKEEQISQMAADHLNNNQQMVSKIGDDHRRDIIVVAAVSALSTLVVQKILSKVDFITNLFGSSTKGSSESKS